MIGKANQLLFIFRSKTRGFTLIELLIALAILALLAAIVIPSYNAQVRRNGRSDAVASLLDVAQELERCRSDFLSYAVAAGCRDFTGGIQSNRRFYTITATAQNATNFSLTATPRANTSQANDNECALFTYNQAGVRGAQDNTAADTTAVCWR